MAILGTVMTNQPERKMSYSTYEYIDLVQDTEVCVTLGVDVNVDERGVYVGYSIDRIVAVDGGPVPAISREEEDELLASAKARYLEEVEYAKRDDY